MAIYINEKVLKADLNGTQLERNYAEGMKKVNALFDKFRVKGNKESYIQIARNAPERVVSMTSRKLKRLPTFALPVVVPYYDEEIGATTIRYSTSPPIRNANNTLSWATKYVEFRETITITDKQKDLAWFLLLASNLVEKGVYKLVDISGEYDGSFAEIMNKKKVTDILLADEPDEEAVYLLSNTLIGFRDPQEDTRELKQIIVDIVKHCEKNRAWERALEIITPFISKKVLKKERVAEIELDGEPVALLEAPQSVKYAELKSEAVALGIKLTAPQQSKDVLYSLIQHIKERPLRVTETSDE